MVFKKEKGDKVKPLGPGDVVEPVKVKHGPTVQLKAHQGPHFSHEEKQHIKFLKKRIHDHKPISEEELEWAKEHKIDVSHVEVAKGKSAHDKFLAKKNKSHKVNYDNLTFD